MRLTIPDDLVEVFQPQASAKEPVEKLLLQQLTKFSHVPVRDRVLIIDGAARDDLEQLLHGPSLTTAADLVNRVRALIDVKIEGVNVALTLAQLEQLVGRAEKLGKTPEALIEETVAQMATQFFDYASI